MEKEQTARTKRRTLCPYCGNPLQNESCKICEKDFSSQTTKLTIANELDEAAILSEDETLSIDFMNEIAEEAKTEEEREEFFFRFAPHVENMKLLVAVRFNEILWSFGLWHEFDVGERYRRERERERKNADLV